jgi:outer membrane receptor protein involved in Fe transport
MAKQRDDAPEVLMSVYMDRFLYCTKITALVLGLGLLTVANQASAQGLEEIIVTAKKRQENIQSVPLSVSAYSGSFLNENSIKDVFDLMTSVPGLVVSANNTASTSNFSIRGIGTGGQNFGLESSVGLYVDGAYRSRQSSMINQLVDIESIEVLRGPQGTLFGKNTASGALLVRTKAPSHEQDGFAEVTIGDDSLLNFSTAFNLSLIDGKLASRTTLFSSNRDGFVKAVNTGAELNERDRFGVRQQFLYTPSDDLSVRVIADYSEIDELCCAALSLKDSFVASGRTNGGLPILGTDAIMTALGGTVFRTGTFSAMELATNTLPASTSEDRGLSIEIIKDFEKFQFTSHSAFRAFDTRDVFDVDFTDVDLALRDYGADQTSFTQEFRLTTNNDSRINYQVGAYFYTQELDSTDDITAGALLNNYVIGVSPDVLGALITAASPQLLGFIDAAYGQTFPLTLANPIQAGSVIHDRAAQDHEAWAVFGEVDFDLSDIWTLSLGLRYTDESKDMVSTFSESIAIPGRTALNVAAITAALGITGNQALAFAGAPFDPTLAAMNPVPFLPALAVLFQPGWANCSVSPRLCPRANLDEDFDDDQVTGNLTLTARPDDRTMYYASFSTGYKSGGTNTDRIGFGFNPIFGPEDTETVELGIKKDFLDPALRINLALYSTEVEDLQTNTFTGTAFNLQNAGDVDIYGAELELWWLPNDSTNFSLAYTYTEAEFGTFEAGNCQIANIFHTGNATEAAQLAANGYCDRSGDRVGGVSDRHLVFNASKTFQLGSGNELFIGGEYIYYSDMMMHNNNDPFALQNGVTLVNLRAGLDLPKSGLAVTFWVRNAFDEDWHGTVFDSPLQDGKLGTYPREGQTAGLTLRKNF